MPTNDRALALAKVRIEEDALGHVEVPAEHRASLTFPCVVGFVAGCAAGAALEVHFGPWALGLPALLAVLAVALGERRDHLGVGTG